MDADYTPFILSINGGDGPKDPNTRKLIRRHVMLGKNRGKKFPDRRKPMRKTAAAAELPVHESNIIAPNSAKSLSKIPRQVGSDLSSMSWAGSVDVSTMAVIMDFTHFTKKSMHLVESCLDFPKKGIEWMEPFITDAAWVHMMAFTSYAVMDVARGFSVQVADQWRSLHFAQSVRLLRERLLENDQALTTTNSTIKVVLALAVHATMHGGFEEARFHLMGLQRMIELRGGIPGFWEWPRMILEIMRTDIGLSIHSATAPLFLQDSSTGAQWPHPLDNFPHAIDDLHLISSNSPKDFLHLLDYELKHAWIILESFSSRINTAAQTKIQLPKELLVDTIASAMYRLLRMHFAPGSLDELVRLSLIAFGIGAFLQWQQSFPMGPTRFPTILRECLRQFGQADRFPHFMMWILLIGALNVFPEEDNTWLYPCLKANLEVCGIGSWDDLHETLRTWPWVDVLHEDRGRAIFTEVYAWDTEKHESRR
ncbi:hypothetical protein F4777DRAFT_88156 [Nemania sp. FL0916]|nr:hypothetical protein F4777DRAFT_88156 [Nemania sp. FL0916]